MKKLFFLSFATAVALSLANCSSDTESIQNENLEFREKSGNFWEPYIYVPDGLYSNYEILSSEIHEVEDGEETWLAVEVVSNETTVGYFVKDDNRGDVYYLDHYNPFVTLYDFTAETEEEYDLSQDPEYDGTLSFDNPGGGERKFWGCDSEPFSGDPYACGASGYNCWCTDNFVTTTCYAFFINYYSSGPDYTGTSVECD